jgi:CubicO group peptidase (beta-lactamase class C family)
MRELGRLYESLLGQGTARWAPETIRLFTSRQRAGLFDHTFGATIDWGLGLVIDSKQHGPGIPYGYGAYCSAQTYGHSGRQCSVAFADPAHGLVVAAAFNGQPGEPAHDRRVRAFLGALYEELGLA